MNIRLNRYITLRNFSCQQVWNVLKTSQMINIHTGTKVYTLILPRTGFVNFKYFYIKLYYIKFWKPFSFCFIKVWNRYYVYIINVTIFLFPFSLPLDSRGYLILNDLRMKIAIISLVKKCSYFPSSGFKRVSDIEWLKDENSYYQSCEKLWWIFETNIQVCTWDKNNFTSKLFPNIICKTIMEVFTK